MNFYRNGNDIKDILVCNDKTVDDIKRHAHLLTVFLHESSFLTEAYILDYFVDTLWNRLPSSWLEIVKNFEPYDIESFLNSKRKLRYQQPWPLSFLSFRACAFALAIPCASIKSTKPIERFLQENLGSQVEKLQSYISEENEWDLSSSEFDNKSGQHKKIPEFCRRHVKPKKQHEIFRMGQVANTVLCAFDINHVVDIGSGQGHLSRLLALCYNLNVVTIEAKEDHVSGAMNFDQQAFSTLKRLKKHTVVKGNEEENQTLPHHVEGSLTLKSSKEYLENILKNVWCQSPSDDGKERIALLGLHTCGDLAATILKTFTKCAECHVLFSVGCCYMKLNSNSVDEGYPLSYFVRSLPHHHLSYEAREMACHALEMYLQRLQANAPSLKIHCYRATLEKCIVHHFPQHKHLGLRGVKHAELLEFSEYAERALSKVSFQIPKTYFLLPEVQSCLKDWKGVLRFYSLRLIIAPIVESLILLDRMLYLFEQGYPSCIAPIFDPSISPRNHLLISARNNVMK